MIVIDSHCDTPSQIMRGRDISIDNERGHVDIPKLKKGGVDASFFALYTPASLSGEAATDYAMRMLIATKSSIEQNKETISFSNSPKGIITNKSNGLISILLGMENGSPIQNSLKLLNQFYDLGVRYMTLTHNCDNAIADSASNGTTWNGLSPFGREVIAEMNKIGMIIDTAHASDKTFYDCLEISTKPIVSTHSCCRALASHKRNMTDDMIRKLADKGGVIQINIYPCFLSDSYAEQLSVIKKEHPEYDQAESDFIKDSSNLKKRELYYRSADALMAYPRPGVDVVVDHIDHAVKVGGIEHVGIGTDFDGIEVTPEGLENISMLGKVFGEMKRRGYSESDIDKVAGGNFLRVFEDVSHVK